CHAQPERALPKVQQQAGARPGICPSSLAPARLLSVAASPGRELTKYFSRKSVASSVNCFN
ncbi:hypothetical protein, partial [Leisingera sp. F5]|uniref:hypothetical protein n=1 Tax=Leisingera sp. F5 TaxID=1813816 RepID=UPI0025B9F5FD